MTIFVNKGEAPLTDAQLEKRSQRYIARDWPVQAREKSIRLGDGSFDAFMATHSVNHDINIVNNLFNTQLAAYRTAVARLDRYVLADGRQEVKEMQPTGEQVFNEETGEMDKMLSKVADFYEDEVGAMVKALTSMLEPAMIVVVGGIVGSILLAMYLPLKVENSEDQLQ